MVSVVVQVIHRPTVKKKPMKCYLECQFNVCGQSYGTFSSPTNTNPSGIRPTYFPVNQKLTE